MDLHQIHGVLISLLLISLSPISLLYASHSISSNSILVALLDSQYTEFSELIDKALLLPSLESSLSNHNRNLTVYAPVNSAFLDPDFKSFLLQPRNLPSLQTLILSHFQFSDDSTNNEITHRKSLIQPELKLESTQPVSTEIVRYNDIVRPDGVIHGIGKLRIPKSVSDDFNRRRSLRSISAVKPEGAPEVDPRTHRLKKAVSVPAGSAPVLPVFDALAPGPSLAPAPAPGPGGPHHHFDGESQVKDFIHTLVHYGGYNELADILVNLTSLATEMGRLVSEGYVLTVLAPNDEAMAKLTTDRLSEPGAPEQIVYYHIIPEYQTEESMYNSVRRFGKVKYDTLRLPHKVTAEEADGSVKFGFGEGSAYLFDPDIYTDGRISVQGIDGVLFPLEETKTTPLVKEGKKETKVVTNIRRGKLLEVACGLLGAVGHDHHFSTCQ